MQTEVQVKKTEIVVAFLVNVSTACLVPWFFWEESCVAIRKPAVSFVNSDPWAEARV